MASRTLPANEANQGNQFLIAAALLIACSVLVTSFLFLIDLEPTNSEPNLFLLPWILVLAVIFAIPAMVFYRQRKFSLANPIIFGTWTYFFPAFVIGGLSLSLGWSQPFYLDHIQDPRTDLPFTVMLIIVGYVALFLGYQTPIATRLGSWIESWLPQWEYDEETCVGPGTILLFVGITTTVLAFILGIMGYQSVERFNMYDGLIIATTQLWIQASFLLCFVIFRNSEWNLRNVFIACLSIVTFIVRALFQGNRSSLLTFFTIILLAYILSGRRFKFKQTLWSGIILTTCVVAGMIYGTTFRAVKGTEARVGIGEYTNNVFTTIDQVGKNDPLSILQGASSSLAERIDTLSSVAVVVSNYEQLLPYEEQYGLNDNIWKDLTTFFVPRIMWPDKPVASDARRYGDLYFDYGENSFAITPIGDLLRNYGVIGVPLGMLGLGILLRVLYRTLIEDQDRVLWRCTIYFMLLTTISYEGFYGQIIPGLVKAGVITVIGVLFVNFFARRKAADHNRSQVT